MIVRNLTLDGFRNLRPGQQWTPCAGVNILAGENAQGKTNLLEACWLFTGSRSFRGAKDSEMIPFDGQKAEIGMDFFAGGREQNARIVIEQRRQVTRNGVKLPSASKMTGNFCGIVFSPAHLGLIKDGPESRRRFVDGAYCPLRPGYIGTMAEFQKVLTQRNALLRQLSDRPGTEEDLLDLWDSTMAVAGTRLTLARSRYVEKLQPLAAEIYDGLSGGREQLSLSWQSPAYTPSAAPSDIAVAWQDLLKNARRADLAAGFSTTGPHREDMEILLDGVPARTYASQGQQRSVVLSLKLAEAMLLQEVIGEPPVAFLDDVMSELDVSRQDYILNHIHDWQVFITCCEPSTALRMTAGEVFQVKQGVISK